MGDRRQQSSPGIGIVPTDDPRSDHLSSSAEPQQQQHGAIIRNARRSSSGEPPGSRSAKRRKENHVRSRVSRACDRCKSRKTRCSGKYPCTLCSQLGLTCQYEAAYTRGRLPSIELETDDRVLQMAAATTNTPHNNHRRHSSSVLTSSSTNNRSNHRITSPRPDAADHHVHHAAAAAAAAAADTISLPSPISIEHPDRLPVDDQPLPQAAGPSQQQPPSSQRHTSAQSSRNSPEPSQNDQQGHYVGPASGASFLLRIQRKLLRQQSGLMSSAGSESASIFTFGDLPLPDDEPCGMDGSFFVLPPQPDAEALLARYFDFAAATHRFLHRPTVEGWLRELYETNGAMRERAAARSRLALLFMVFAQAGNTRCAGMTGREYSSARFFSAAEHQLSAEKGEIRLTSVQARLVQCFWLLGQSRINHCWSLFGTTAHLVLALGMHRKRRIDSSVDYIDLECRKRTFWCAYNLDTYLSAALGRPRTFHDEDIDQEFPTCVNDSDLHVRQMHPSPNKSQSLMSGCIAHMRFSRILANILRDLYGIRPPSTEDRYRLAAKYNDELNNWRASVGYLLDTDGVDPSLFQPIFLRQRNVLNLAFWHAQILVHRPFLLSNFAGLTSYNLHRGPAAASSGGGGSGGGKLTWHVQRCLDAATNIVRVVDELTRSGQIYSTFWFTHYFAFCAVVVLYVHTIQQQQGRLPPAPDPSSPSSSTSSLSPDYFFRAASRCHDQIARVATKGSLAERYAVVLQELRLELLRHNHHYYGIINGEDSSSNRATANAGLGLAAAVLPPEMVFGAGAGGAGGQQQADELAAAAGLEGLGGQQGGGAGGLEGAFAEASPSSSIAQMTGWGQFDSLVVGGIGSLESLLADSTAGWDLDLGGELTGIA
ncbi:putative transcriptional regulatory protein [Lasiodiplodia theobromae]|uniref:Putative transcriptional regulatory protein n=1 Tax=Lasiodiplodia theobromae TaxID=45133 RepID=A0A5N5D1D0_9PEZI|nr:putative transcriptional regulatory protein [Lasiodiplodia theobromae]